MFQQKMNRNIIFKETLNKACSQDALSDFSTECTEIPQADLVSGKGFLGNMTENLQADCVQSRQAGFIQCFLKAIPHKVR